MEINLEKYKAFRRLYPTLVTSWSLYSVWKSGNIDNVWKYLLGIPFTYGEKIEEAFSYGDDIHRLLEGATENDIKNLLWDYWQFDTINDIQTEQLMGFEIEGYPIPVKFMMKVDLLFKGDGRRYMIDWKTGTSDIGSYKKQLYFYDMGLSQLGIKIHKGAIAKVDVYENDGTLYVSGFFEVLSSRENREEAMDMLDDLIQDILYRISQGELDNFVKHHPDLLLKMLKEKRNATTT